MFGANTQPLLSDPANPLTSNFKTESLRDVGLGNLEIPRGASLLWHATSWLDVALAYQRQEDHSNGFSRQTQGLTYIDDSLIPNAPDDRTIDLDSLTLSADIGLRDGHFIDVIREES